MNEFLNIIITNPEYFVYIIFAYMVYNNVEQNKKFEERLSKIEELLAKIQESNDINKITLEFIKKILGSDN